MIETKTQKITEKKSPREKEYLVKRIGWR